MTNIPRHLLLPALAAAMLSLAGASVAAPSTPTGVKRGPGEPRMIFVLDAASALNPLAVLTPAGLVDANSVDQPEVRESGASPYHTPGRTYYAYGGGQSGKARVTGQAPLGCDDTAATAEADIATDAAILTNFALGRPAQGVAVEPDAAERATMQQLARAYLGTRQARPADIERLLRADAEGSRVALQLPGGAPLLFFSASFERTNAAATTAHDLTFVAEADDQRQYRITYVDLRRERGGESRSTHGFATAVDLDGDGQVELVLKAGGYEWFGYEIVARRGGKWHKIVSAVTGGC